FISFLVIKLPISIYAILIIRLFLGLSPILISSKFLITSNKSSSFLYLLIQHTLFVSIHSISFLLIFVLYLLLHFSIRLFGDLLDILIFLPLLLLYTYLYVVSIIFVFLIIYFEY